MPPAAAAAVGIGANVVGNVLGAKAANPKLTPIPPPAPVFQGLNTAYLGAIGQGGQQGISQLGQLSRTGNPVDVMPLFQSIIEASKRGRSEGRANIMENLPAYGSSRRDALVDFESQSTKDLTQTLADLMRQMSEGASQRSLGASGLLAQMFGSSAMTLAPTAALTTGGQSPLGAGLQAGGQGLSQLALLRAFGII